MKAVFAVLITTLLSTSAFGRTFKVDLQNPNTINLNGIVSHSLVQEPITQILERAGKTKTITMLINSPGGEIYSGQRLISAMQLAQSRGTQFKCAVSTLAASMAFQILSFCDHRYVMTNSLLLWHPPRISGNVILTPRDAVMVAKELLRLEKVLTDDLQDNLPIPSKVFWPNYHAETLWFGSEIGKLLPQSFTVVDDIDGLDTFEIRRDMFFQLNGILEYTCPVKKCNY